MKILQVGPNDCLDHVFNFVQDHKEEISELTLVEPLIECVNICRDKYSFLGDRLTVLNRAIAPANGIEYLWSNGSQSGHASLDLFHLTAHRDKEEELHRWPVVSLRLRCGSRCGAELFDGRRRHFIQRWPKELCQPGPDLSPKRTLPSFPKRKGLFNKF